jgi:hypothetical protein
MALVLLGHVIPARAQEGPTLFLRPNPVPSGDQVEAIGSGYCGRTSCSTVTVTLDGTRVAEGVQVRSDGVFSATFVVEVMAGQYNVTASQSDGPATIASSATLTVANRDTQLTGTSTPGTTRTTVGPATTGSSSTSASTTASSTKGTATTVASTSPAGGTGDGRGRGAAGGEQTGDGSGPWAVLAAVVVGIALLGAAGYRARRAARRRRESSSP